MKASYSFLSLLMVASLTSLAQPVILNGNNVPDTTLNVTVAMASPADNGGPAGAAQTWDYSALTFNQVGTYQVVNPASTSNASYFSTSNYAGRLVPAGSSTNLYNYYRVSGSMMEAMAYSFTAPGTGSDMTPNPRTVLKFPFNFTDNVTDTWQKTGGSVNTVKLTYDGYGTLKVPGKTYQNVVRIKEEYGNGSDYQWYILNPLSAVLTYDHNVNALYYINLMQINTGVDHHTESQSRFSLYPNPAVSMLHFDVESGSEIEVFDLNGALQIHTNVADIDISQLMPGMYFVKACTGGYLTTARFVKE